MNGNVEKAKASYLRALCIKPTDADTLMGLAVLYFEQKDYENTIFYCRECLAHTPLCVQAWIYLGAAEQEMGQVENAREHLNYGIELQKTEPICSWTVVPSFL
jgi:tetratricopeptide (TPR) repeat protein